MVLLHRHDRNIRAELKINQDVTFCFKIPEKKRLIQHFISTNQQHTHYIYVIYILYRLNDAYCFIGLKKY